MRTMRRLCWGVVVTWLPAGFGSAIPTDEPTVTNEAAAAVGPAEIGEAATPTQPAAAETPAATDAAADCVPPVRVEVWEDLDADGQREAGERPFPNVRVTAAYRVGGDFTPLQEDTDADGVAVLDPVFTGECEIEQYIVTIDRPLGYDPSTPLALDLDIDQPQTVEFGLAVSTRTPEPTAVPTSTPQGNLVPVADSYTLMGTSIDGCVTLPPEAIEDILGPLAMPASTGMWVTAPLYDRVPMTCSLPTATNSIYVDLWYAPTGSAAREDYDHDLELIGEEAIPLQGLGEAAIYWPRGQYLGVLHQNAHLWITFAEPEAGLPETASRLAAEALMQIDPSLGSVDPPSISVPAGAPVPDAVQLGDIVRQGEFFEACSLLTTAEFEDLLGELDQEPVSGSSVGELVGTFYDCMVSSENLSMYYSVFFNETPAKMLLSFYRDDAGRPPDAELIDGLGDGDQPERHGAGIGASRPLV